MKWNLPSFANATHSPFQTCPIFLPWFFSLHLSLYSTTCISFICAFLFIACLQPLKYKLLESSDFFLCCSLLYPKVYKTLSTKLKLNILNTYVPIRNIGDCKVLWSWGSGFSKSKIFKSKIDNGQTTILLTPLIVQNPETCRTAQPVVSRALGRVVVEVQAPLNSDRS